MLLVVGRVGRPHGLRGEVTVEVRTDDPADRFRRGAVLLTDPAGSGPLTIAGVRWNSGRLLLTFDGYEDRDAAEELRDTLLQVDSDDLEPLADPEEFYDHDLIGLSVVTVGGEVVGTVGDVLHYGQDLLVVEASGARSGAEILIPFVAAIVPEVDVAGGRLVVDPPAGLLDPDAAV
ncbi:MAG TPA: ribosome maturation factor RimM [Streptosporangiaceae bacterium]|nr:ribosome maturation factor RimM [Streptosporangiaceae bacterium]